ncbi:MAG TPA: hypothetical protein VFE24_08260, partial [Pirellulales bacterium]|nr:hypothetical protein [Pirellulales bacterium]
APRRVIDRPQWMLNLASEADVRGFITREHRAANGLRKANRNPRQPGFAKSAGVAILPTPT